MVCDFATVLEITQIRGWTWFEESGAGSARTRASSCSIESSPAKPERPSSPASTSTSRRWRRPCGRGRCPCLGTWSPRGWTRPRTSIRMLRASRTCRWAIFSAEGFFFCVFVVDVFEWWGLVWVLGRFSRPFQTKQEIYLTYDMDTGFLFRPRDWDVGGWFYSAWRGRGARILIGESSFIGRIEMLKKKVAAGFFVVTDNK